MPLFHVLTGGKAYMSKTFDDQIGVALMVDVLRHFSQASHSNVLYGVATVMEEVGPPGGGPTLMLLDARMIPNLRLRNLVIVRWRRS